MIFEVGSYEVHIYSRSVPYCNHRLKVSRPPVKNIIFLSAQIQRSRGLQKIHWFHCNNCRNSSYKHCLKECHSNYCKSIKQSVAQDVCSHLISKMHASLYVKLSIWLLPKQKQICVITEANNEVKQNKQRKQIGYSHMHTADEEKCCIHDKLVDLNFTLCCTI